MLGPSFSNAFSHFKQLHPQLGYPALQPEPLSPVEQPLPGEEKRSVAQLGSTGGGGPYPVLSGTGSFRLGFVF